MIKKIIGLFFAFLVIIILMPEVTAHAAPNLKVSVTAGIDGKAKMERGGPIAITVENTGTSFSGDLVVDVLESYDQGAGRAIPLELGSGETKTLSFVVNNLDALGGMYGQPSKQSIFFFEGGWEKGKEIPYKGPKILTASLFQDTKFIVTFTNNIDRLASLKGIEIGSTSDVQVIDSSKIDIPNFPNDVLAWDSVDYMVFDEYALADLKIEKQEALLEWVQKGGTIVIGSSDNVEGEAGVFSSYLPLKLKEQTTIEASLLNEWAKTDDFVDPIQAYSTTLSEGAAAHVRDKENVLVASNKVGKGLVLQTAFSLGDEPIAKSSGMPAFWSMLFSTGEKTTFFSSLYSSSPINQVSHSIGDTTELFPSFKVSVSLILGIIILYAFLIIPILYFVLKRKDKREYAWWIIPGIALLTSIAIFGYGAKDRIGRVQIQHTAVLNVGQDGVLQGYYAESFLSNKSGKFSFTAPDETTLAASSPEVLFDASKGMTHKRTILEENATGSTLHFRNVGYWNVATVYGESKVTDIGQYKIDLAVDNEKLTGSVTNDFPFGLKEVSIWSGNRFIPIEDLNPGETVQIDEELKTQTLLPINPVNNMVNQPQMNGDDLMEMRKNSLISFTGENMSDVRSPVLVGYTDTQVIPVNLEGVKSTTSALTMIMQPIDIEFTIEGPFTIQEGVLDLSVTANEDGYGEYVIDNLADAGFYEGVEYLQMWTLPEQLTEKEVIWASIKLSNIKQKLYSSSLLNVKTGKYEQVDEKDLLISEHISDYISEEGTIVNRIRFHAEEYGESSDLPKMELTGEVAK